MKASLVFACIGLAIAAVGAWLLLRAHRKVEGRPIIQGQVVELIPVRGSKGGTSYKLRVAYTDPGGNRGELTTRWAQNPPAAKAGETVKLAWTGSEEPPVLLLFASLFGTGFVMMVFGLAMLFICGGFAYGPEVIRRLYLS